MSLSHQSIVVYPSRYFNHILYNKNCFILFVIQWFIALSNNLVYWQSIKPTDNVDI